MSEPTKPIQKQAPDRLKHFAEDSAGVRLGALAIELMPDILRALGYALGALALLIAALYGVDTVAPYALRLLRLL
jgi:hypothetical protein